MTRGEVPAPAAVQNEQKTGPVTGPSETVDRPGPVMPGTQRSPGYRPSAPDLTERDRQPAGRPSSSRGDARPPAVPDRERSDGGPRRIEIPSVVPGSDSPRGRRSPAHPPRERQLPSRTETRTREPVRSESAPRPAPAERASRPDASVATRTQGDPRELFRKTPEGNGFRWPDAAALASKGLTIDHPGTTHHQLPRHVPDENVLFIGEDPVQTNAVIAQFVAGQLRVDDLLMQTGKQQDSRHILMVDAHNGGNCIKAAGEAALAGYSVEVNTTLADESVATSKPGQFNQNLAGAAADYLSQTGEPKVNEASLLRVVEKTCNTLRDLSDQPGVNPTMEEIEAGLSVLAHRKDDELRRDKGGPLNDQQIEALRVKMTKEEVETYKEEIKILQDYVNLQLPKDSSSVSKTAPQDFARARSHADLTGMSRVLVDIIPDTGTTPGSNQWDLYLNHLITQQGDNERPEFPSLIVVSGNMNKRQINKLLDYTRSRNVRVIIVMDTPEETGHMLRMTGTLIFGELSDIGASFISAAMGDQTKWETTVKSHEKSENTSTTRNPRVKTKTSSTGSSGFFRRPEKSSGTSITPKHKVTTVGRNESYGETQGWNTRKHLPRDVLPNIGKDSVLVLGNDADDHKLVPLHAGTHRAGVSTRGRRADELTAKVKAKRDAKSPSSKKRRSRSNG